ncbi:MAG: tyrosine-type recombinase/integrase [Deinococcus sp.]|nr:tyrosine-type recombinase/integrase [Deinococcus sp.]
MPRKRPIRENETQPKRRAKKGLKQAWRDSIKYLTVEEVHTLLNAATDYRDHLVLNLLYRAGMRVGELTRVQVEDLILAERFIEIPTAHTKTRQGAPSGLPAEGHFLPDRAQVVRDVRDSADGTAHGLDTGRGMRRHGLAEIVVCAAQLLQHLRPGCVVYCADAPALLPVLRGPVAPDPGC